MDYEKKVLSIAKSQGTIEEVRFLHDECNNSWESIYCDMNPSKLTISVNGVDFQMIFVKVDSKNKDKSLSPQNRGLDSYYMGEVPVTQALWEAVMGSNPSADHPIPFISSDNINLKDPNYPVTMVSWHDCQKFIKTLSSLTKYKFHLPTKEEWEFAASGGDKTKNYTYSGSNNVDDVAVYDPNPDGSNYLLTPRPYFAHTRVATKLPNELGFFDMSGLVGEWCEDKVGRDRLIKGVGHDAFSCQVRANCCLGPRSCTRYTGLRLSMDAIYHLEKKQIKNEIEDSQEQYTKDGKTLKKYTSSSRKAEFVVRDGTKKIAKYAFKDAKLKVISIPDSVQEIDVKAFSGCKNLTAVNINSRNPYYSSDDGMIIDKRNGQSTFMFCPKNKKGEISLKDDISQINQGSFRDCTKITSITISNNVQEIDPIMFEGCKNLTAVNIKPGNPNYSSDDGILIDKRDGQFTVIFCPKKKSGEIVLKEGISTIGPNVFYNCRNITCVKIPQDVLNIGDSAFRGCWSLKKIKLPNSLKKIGTDAFRNTALEEILIPQKVMEIGSGAFEGCSSLKNVELPSSIVEISDFTFRNCNQLLKMSIPSKVLKIGNLAFDGCCQLIEVVIPQGVTEIGFGAFQHAESLKRLSIPNSVTKIGAAAFNGTSIVSFSLPNKITKIEDLLYAKCKITHVSIPFGVTDIGEEAFYGCSHLEHVSIPNTVENIESRAFEDCSSLCEISIPNNVKRIGEYAFSGCSRLKCITIPSNVIAVQANAFLACEYLNTVIIKGRDTEFACDVFDICTHLKRIVVPKGTLQKYLSVLTNDGQSMWLKDIIIIEE